jgi:type IV pilus assembly protein PilB
MEKEAGWLKSDFVSDDEMRREAAQALGIPFIILAREDISPDALELIPEPLSRTRNAIAYRRGEGVVEIALLDMADLPALDFLQANMKVKTRLTDRDSIKRGLLVYQKKLREKFAGMVERGAEAADSLLRHALYSSATHIHLEPAAAGMVVRYRIEGALHEAMRLPKEVGDKIAERLKSLARLFSIPTAFQEGRFKVEHGDETFTVHLSTMPTAAGEKLHLRLAREKQGQTGLTMRSLGFHGAGLECMHELLQRKSQFLAVCGPAGNGKTTTLYTLLDLLNAPHRALATIENHIEYRLPHVAQTQTRPDIGLSVLAGLRAVLRTDPDVVMVGDIESRDVAALMFQAATRGLLMLGAAQDVALVEQADVIVYQRLVKKLCPECKESYKLPRSELNTLESAANFGTVLAALKEEEVVPQEQQWKDLLVYRGKGCGKCENGYKGMIGLQEINSQPYEGLTLIEDGLFKAVQGLTSVEEVLNLVSE